MREYLNWSNRLSLSLAASFAIHNSRTTSLAINVKESERFTRKQQISSFLATILWECILHSNEKKSTGSIPHDSKIPETKIRGRKRVSKCISIKNSHLNAMEIQQLMNFNDSNWNLFAKCVCIVYFWYFHWF